MILNYLTIGALPRKRRVRKESVSFEKLEDSLTYIFETVLPRSGYALRTGQLELARQIFASLKERSMLLSEAGVGIGKTHAYLIAAAAAKRGGINDFWLRDKYPGMAHITKMPIVIATSSIALQKAIVQDYIPEISRILMEDGIIAKPLTGVIRKGKEHYICEKRLCMFRSQSKRLGMRELLTPLIDKSEKVNSSLHE